MGARARLDEVRADARRDAAARIAGLPVALPPPRSDPAGRRRLLRAMLPATPQSLREARPDLWPVDPSALRREPHSRGCSSKRLQRDLREIGAAYEPVTQTWSMPDVPPRASDRCTVCSAKLRDGNPGPNCAFHTEAVIEEP